VNGRSELDARAHELRERAAALAGPMAREATGRTTLSCERSVLRLFGVTGVDARGRPLAHEVVERLAALGPARFAGGVALPFAAAALEYDLAPQEVALEIASGHVDLALEAELLREHEKRQAAEAAVEGWLEAAWHRFDANRTARAELRDLLGDRDEPWIGVELPAGPAGRSAEAASRLVEDGVDLVSLRVPRDRELARGLGEEAEPAESGEEPDDAPAGSQRGLGLLRSSLDEGAADRGRYVRLATSSLGLAAPDQAVVAGFERVDVCFADPVRAVVELGVEPSRALSDHAFAVNLHARSGVQLAIGAGAVAVAPEIARGQPLDPRARAGRGLALQALGVELTRALGLPVERILVGAVPPDLLADADGLADGLAEVGLRRLVFPGHGLFLEEPDSTEAVAGWSEALVAWLAPGSGPALVLCRPGRAFRRREIQGLRTAARAAAWLSTARPVGELRGATLDDATTMMDAALATLRGLGAEGWEPLLETPAAARPGQGGRLGARGVQEKRDYHDPFRSRTAADDAAVNSAAGSDG
jgi:hypothetical protein